MRISYLHGGDMAQKGYFTPTVTVKKKRKVVAVDKVCAVEHIAKSIKTFCTKRGLGCKYQSRCRHGWLCEEIHKENLNIGYLGNVAVKPNLTSAVVKALLRFTCDEGAGELFDAYTKHTSDPNRGPIKYNGLVAAANLNLSLKRDDGIRRIKTYMETLV